MPVQIHGKSYETVAERIQKAGIDLRSVETRIISHEPVVIKAVVTTLKGQFTGISAADPSKAIEKTNPYEVAETSAVGRALAFAGYGTETSIASADEMQKSQASKPAPASAPARQSFGKPVVATVKQVQLISILLEKKGQSDNDLKKKYQVESKKDLTMQQASTIIDNLTKLPDVAVNESTGKVEKVEKKQVEVVDPNDIPDDLGSEA